MNDFPHLHVIQLQPAEHRQPIVGNASARHGARATHELERRPRERPPRPSRPLGPDFDDSA